MRAGTRGAPCQIDMIEAGGPSRDEFRAAAGELFQHCPVHGIVDEDADRREPRRQGCRTGSELHIEIDELVDVAGVQLIEQSARVFLALNTAIRIAYLRS